MQRAKIPAGFIKRETKPGDFETLTSRIIDRSLRPLFPKGFNYPVVITVMVLSSDADVDMQIASLYCRLWDLLIIGYSWNYSKLTGINSLRLGVVKKVG